MFFWMFNLKDMAYYYSILFVKGMQVFDKNSTDFLISF